MTPAETTVAPTTAAAVNNNFLSISSHGYFDKRGNYMPLEIGIVDDEEFCETIRVCLNESEVQNVSRNYIKKCQREIHGIMCDGRVGTSEKWASWNSDKIEPWLKKQLNDYSKKKKINHIDIFLKGDKYLKNKLLATGNLSSVFLRIHDLNEWSFLVKPFKKLDDALKMKYIKKYNCFRHANNCPCCLSKCYYYLDAAKKNIDVDKKKNVKNQ